MRGLWIAASVLAVWQVATLFRYFSDPRPDVWEGTLLPQFLAQVFLVLSVGLGCLTLYRSGQKLELSREREQTKWILWGIAIGLTPLVFVRLLPRLWRQTLPVPPEVDRVFELAIPVAVTFAVVRYRFDVDIIIRRSVIYGTVTAWQDFIIATATDAANLGGYEPPFWVTTKSSDLPAPVSPVQAQKPGCSSTRTSSIRARFCTESSRSMQIG